MSIVMFILGLILLGLLALTAHSISGMFVAMNDLSMTSRERQIDLIWESGISSQMVQAGPNGEYVAPLGAILTSSTGSVIGHTIPSTTPGPRLNTKGYAPRYCALGRDSLSGGSSQAVTLSIASTYSVETVNVGGIDYVTRSNDVAVAQACWASSSRHWKRAIRCLAPILPTMRRLGLTQHPVSFQRSFLYSAQMGAL